MKFCKREVFFVLVFITILGFATNINSAPTIQVLNFTDLIANQTITAMRDVNITFNATFDSDTDGDNVTLLIYNNTGTNFIIQMNFSNYVNGSLGSYLFNSSNYTKGDTIVIEAYAWNGTVNSSFVNISSYINGTNNEYVCFSNESCEYQNLTEALYGVNNTAYFIYLLENNTEYNTAITTEYTFTANEIDLKNLINVTVDCNGTSLVGETRIELVDTRNTTIRNCRIRSDNYYDITDLRSIRINITNNTFLETGTGTGAILLSMTNDSYISFNNDTSRGMFINTEGVVSFHNNTIEYNNIYKGNERGVVGGQVIRFNDGNNATLSGNNFYYMFSDILWDGMIEGKIFNNTFMHSTADNILSFSVAPTYYMEVQNNTFYNSTGTAIAIEFGNHTIINNNFTLISGYGILSAGSNVSVKNNYFINISDNPVYINNKEEILLYNNIFYENKKGLFLHGSEFNIINNTFNKTGNKIDGYFISYSPFTYNGVDYNACVRIASGAADIEAIRKDNTLVTDPDGAVHYRLYLYSDAANALGCGGTKKLTLWVASDYPVTCDALPGVIGGSCDYNNTYVFEAQGANNNYVFNSSIASEGATVISGNSQPSLDYNGYFFQTEFPIDLRGVTNSNITGNKFYNTNTNFTAINDHPTSKNNTFWLNYFYGRGFNQSLNNSGCYNKMGNYYTDYDTLILAQHECGLETPGLSIEPSAETSMYLGDILSISCSGSDDLNETSIELSIGGSSVCTNSPTGLQKSASCSYDYKASDLGDIDVLCTYVDKATNLVTQANTLTVRAGSGSTGSSGSTGGGGPGEVVDVTTEEQTTTLTTEQSTTFRYDDLDHTIIIDSISLEALAKSQT